MPDILLTPSNLQNFSHLISSVASSEYVTESDGAQTERGEEYHKLLYVLEGGIRCGIREAGKEEALTLTARQADVCFCPAGRHLCLTPQRGASYLLFEFRYFGVRADYYSQNSLAISGRYVPPRTAFELEADVVIERGAAVGLVFGFGNPMNWSCASYDIEARVAHIFGEYGAVQLSLPPERCRLNQAYRLKIVLDPTGVLSYYADGEPVGALSVPEFRGGYLGVNSYISHARFSDVRFFVGERNEQREALLPLDGLEPFTGFWKKEGEILRAENHHGSRSSAERSYLYNEASFPLSPPIEKLDILLPWIMHTEGHRKIPLCIREIEREIREHAAGYNNMVKVFLNELLLSLLRLTDPASNALITAADAVCLRAAEGAERPERLELTDIQLLSSRGTASHPPQIIGVFPSARVAGEAGELSFAAEENGGRFGEFGEIARLCIQEAFPPLWIRSEQQIELRNFLGTACIRFAVKAERPVSLELVFHDSKSNAYVVFPVKVTRAGLWQTFHIPFRKANFRQASVDYCRLAKEYVALHYHEKISVRDVAESVHVTAAYLSRLFREETGTPLKTYLIDYRMEKARALLSRTDLSMHEIASRVGFYDSAHFFHTFSQREGLPPGEYRKRERALRESPVPEGSVF